MLNTYDCMSIPYIFRDYGGGHRNEAAGAGWGWGCEALRCSVEPAFQGGGRRRGRWCGCWRRRPSSGSGLAPGVGSRMAGFAPMLPQEFPLALPHNSAEGCSLIHGQRRGLTLGVDEHQVDEFPRWDPGVMDPRAAALSPPASWVRHANFPKTTGPGTQHALTIASRPTCARDEPRLDIH